MSGRKITDLPVYDPDTSEWVELAAIDWRHTVRRVNIGQHVIDTEAEAIELVKEIYRGKGMKAFILPYKDGHS